jgi:ABC-type lipoprotein export system ATPase subunit
MRAILECNGVSKVYGQGPLAERVLSEVTFAITRGETCALLGPSGSGKTTLLSIIGCLLTPTSGELRIDQELVDHASRFQLVALRRSRIGFIFQLPQLLPFLTMEENLQVFGRNAGLGEAKLGLRIAEVAARLGIDRLLDKSPDLASGGERQRVAIARAVLHRPPILLADEPTASLDWKNGETVIRMLTEQARAENASLMTVTHDTRLLDYFDRVFHIDNGRLVEG